MDHICQHNDVWSRLREVLLAVDLDEQRGLAHSDNEGHSVLSVLLVVRVADHLSRWVEPAEILNLELGELEGLLQQFVLHLYSSYFIIIISEYII